MDSLQALDPYRAPRADVEIPQPPLDRDAPLASRTQRFFGALIDALLNMLAHAVIYLGVSRAQVYAAENDVFRLYLRMGPWGYVAGSVVLGVALLEWYLIGTRGQTVGKIVARSRIVRMSGAPVDFLHGVMLRNWIFAAPGLVLPLLRVPWERVATWGLSGLAVVDVLFIFAAGNRCLHDRLANTKVIASRRDSSGGRNDGSVESSTS